MTLLELKTLKRTQESSDYVGLSHGKDGLFKTISRDYKCENLRTEKGKAKMCWKEVMEQNMKERGVFTDRMLMIT